MSGQQGWELWFAAPRRVELRAMEIPEPDRGAVVVRALASGVSQGTELLLYRGEGPTPFDPSLAGDEAGPGETRTYPCRYGYAWVGLVESGSSAIDRGRLVFALAPHATHHVLHPSELRVLDDVIPPRRAVLAANLETAITCVWDARVTLGDKVVVLGAGVVGLLATWLLVQSGCEVHVVEPSPLRRGVAIALGARTAVTPEEDAPRGDADVVVEVTGHPAALRAAILHAGFEARIVVSSFYGARHASLDLGSVFHRRRLVLCASQVSHLPASHLCRWSRDRRFALVQRLLRDPMLDRLLTRTVPFEAAPRVYAELDRAPGETIQTVFTYEA